MRPSATCALAEHEVSLVPEDRRDRFQLALAFTRLSLARIRIDLNAAGEAAQATARLYQLLRRRVEPGLRARDLLAMTLTDVGIAAMWAGRLEEGERHLEPGIGEGPADRQAPARAPRAGAPAARRIFRVQGTAEAAAPGRRSSWRGSTVWRRTRRRRRIYRARRGARVARARRGSGALAGAGRKRASRRMKPTRHLGWCCAPVGPCWSSSRGRPAQAMTYLRAAERMEMSLVMPHAWTLRRMAPSWRLDPSGRDRSSGAVVRRDG